MNRTHRNYILTTAGFLSAVVLAAVLSGSRKNKEAAPTVTVGAAPLSAAPSAVASIPVTIAKIEEKPVLSPATPARKIEEALKFDFKTELTTYANLKAKVFLSPAEKAERRRLITNTAMLRSFEPLLRQPAAVATEIGQMQNDALDLLLEATSQGDSAADEVLRSVVSDAQIERADGDPQARRLLAGLKAEVLYQWSARDPSRAAEMERWLPGPVSQRIWENVRAAQQQNFAEGAALASSGEGSR